MSGFPKGVHVSLTSFRNLTDLGHVHVTITSLARVWIDGIHSESDLPWLLPDIDIDDKDFKLTRNQESK